MCKPIAKIWRGKPEEFLSITLVCLSTAKAVKVGIFAKWDSFMRNLYATFFFCNTWVLVRILSYYSSFDPLSPYFLLTALDAERAE